jgi:hypothetical protein
VQAMELPRHGLDVEATALPNGLALGTDLCLSTGHGA